MGWIGYYTSLIILIKINSSDMCKKQKKNKNKKTKKNTILCLNLT